MNLQDLFAVFVQDGTRLFLYYGCQDRPVPEAKTQPLRAPSSARGTVGYETEACDRSAFDALRDLTDTTGSVPVFRCVPMMGDVLERLR